jgi:hypothetical protein
LSSRLSSVDVAGARDDFWGYHRLVLIRLAANLSNEGAVVWLTGTGACSYGRVSMSGSDGTTSSTQVPTVSCTWGRVLSCQALNATTS